MWAPRGDRPHAELWKSRSKTFRAQMPVGLPVFRLVSCPVSHAPQKLGIGISTVPPARLRKPAPRDFAPTARVPVMNGGKAGLQNELEILDFALQPLIEPWDIRIFMRYPVNPFRCGPFLESRRRSSHGVDISVRVAPLRCRRVEVGNQFHRRIDRFQPAHKPQCVVYFPLGL